MARAATIREHAVVGQSVVSPSLKSGVHAPYPASVCLYIFVSSSLPYLICAPGLGSRRLNATVTSAIYIGLGLALLWQAARLAVVGLSTFPTLGILVYLEGLCMIGSVLTKVEMYSDVYGTRGSHQNVFNVFFRKPLLGCHGRTTAEYF